MTTVGSPMMFAFSETDTPKHQKIINLKINNFLPESEVNLKELKDVDYEPIYKKPQPMNIVDKMEDIDQIQIEKLEKSGVLNWDGSESSFDADEENELFKTISQKRANFLNTLNKYENEVITRNKFYQKQQFEQQDFMDTKKTPSYLEDKTIDRKGMNFDISDESLNEINNHIDNHNNKHSPGLKNSNNKEFDVKTDESYELDVFSHHKHKKHNEPESNHIKLKDQETSSNRNPNDRSKNYMEESVKIKNDINNSLNIEIQYPNTDSKLKKDEIQNLEMNYSMDSKPKPKSKQHRRKYNTMTLSAKTRKSLIREAKNEIEYDDTPRFTKIIIKIKDTDIQTDDEPVIKPEHLIDISNLDISQINKQTYEKPEPKINISKRDLRKIIKLQRFYKERYQQKVFLEYRIKILKDRNIRIIQNYVRLFLSRIHTKILLTASKNDKVLLKKKIVKVKAPSNSFFDFYSYFLRVFLIKGTKSLNWIFYDFLSKRIIETFSDITSVIDHDLEINSPDNKKHLLEFIESKIPLIDINEGFVEFKKPQVNETLNSIKDDDFEYDKNEENQNEIHEDAKINKKTYLKGIEFLQQKIREMLDKRSVLNKRLKRYKVNLVLHKKLTVNAYLRLCYCTNKGESGYHYIGGAILTDATYKLNVVKLDNVLLKYYNNNLTPSIIFDIIAVDIHKKTISLTEEAQFKIELQEKIQVLKTQRKKTNFDQTKIIKLQAFMKAAFCKRLYEIKKLQFKLKKNAVLLTRKYILKEKERYLLRISYTKHENSISFRIMDLKNIEKPADAKQKLYENFSLNELKHFANSIYARASIKHLENRQLKLIVPRIEELISEKKNENHSFTGEDKKTLEVEKDPLLESKFKFAKEFFKVSLENDQKLLRIFIIESYKQAQHNKNQDEDPEDLIKIKKIQQFYRHCLFKRKFNSCATKHIRRTDFANFEKYFNIKDLGLLDESPLRKKNKYIEEEKKKFLKQKKKTNQDPYKKDIIIIRKFNHSFNNKELAKLKVYYHIYFHTIIIDIKYKNLNRTQQLTNPLSFFGMVDFNKSFFIKNFDEIILKCLHYVESEQTVYYVKQEKIKETILKPKPKPVDRLIVKPGSSPSKSIDKFKLTIEERRELNNLLMHEKNLKTNIFLERIHQKLEDDYFSMQLFVNIEENVIKFKAKKFDDPYQTIEKNLFLPNNANEFLNNNRENQKKVKNIFSHFIKKVKETILWEEKSLKTDRIYKEFDKVVKLEYCALKIQNAFRRQRAKKNLNHMKNSLKKKKILILRKYYKISGSYTDVLFFLLANQPIIHIKASNLNHKKKNIKIFQIDLRIFIEKADLQIKSKENMTNLALQIIKSMSIKIINDNIHILTNNEDILLEELETIVESDRDYKKRVKRKSSLLAFIIDQESSLLKTAKIHEKCKNKEEEIRETAARLIQTRFRILKLQKRKELSKYLLNMKTVYLLTIIEKIQGNYILAYFYYLKPLDEIMINFANLNHTKHVLRSYTINIQSISRELYSLLVETKKKEKQKPAYYQKLFGNLLKFLWKRIDITFLYDKIVANSLDRNIKLNDVSEMKKRNRDMEQEELKNTSKKNLQIIINLQRIFRRNKTRYLFNLIKDCEAKRVDYLKKFGVKIKHKIKIFNEIPYYIYVYLKTEQNLQKVEKKLLTFIAVKHDKKVKSEPKIKLYHSDNIRLINTNGMDVVDFLVSNLKIYDDQIVFDTENLVALEKYSSDTIKEINDEELTSPQIKGNFFSLMKMTKATPSEELSPIFKKKVNLEEFSKPVIEIETIPKIIHQKREDINENQVCVFNVYYNKSKSSKLDEKIEENKDFCQIEIDLKDIKKFNPMVDFYDKQALKNFAEELTQCIKANENGDILIDSNKINPKCLHLIKKPLPSENSKSKIDPNKEFKKYDKKKLLAKGMKFIGLKKYFLTANYIERPIHTQRNAFFKSDVEVFEDYESLVEIVATNISNESIKIQWEMAEQYAYILSNTTNIKEAAKYLLDKVQIIGFKGDKFLYALSEEAFGKFSPTFLKEEYKNVVFLQEKAIRILQNKIRSRKYHMNYKYYLRDISKKTIVVLVKGVFKLGKEKSLIYLIKGEKSENFESGALEIAIWDLKLFRKSKIQVKYGNYEDFLDLKIANRIRSGALKIIQSFISINEQKINFDEKSCLESLRKFDILENNKN